MGVKDATPRTVSEGRRNAEKVDIGRCKERRGVIDAASAAT